MTSTLAARETQNDRHLELATLLVVSDEVVFVEQHGGCVDEVLSVTLQQAVVLQLVVGDPVQRARPQHPDVQVRVSCNEARILCGWRSE